jgi:hypothetical protein
VEVTLYPTHLQFLRNFDIYLSHRRTIRTSNINKDILVIMHLHFFTVGISDIFYILETKQMNAPIHTLFIT